LKFTKLSEAELSELEEIVTQHIYFIDERLVPENVLEGAQELLKDIDENDTVFVALTDFLKGALWTGDLQLYNGLKAKNYQQVLLTADLLSLLDQNGSFNFLKEDEEIYTLADLKVVYNG